MWAGSKTSITGDAYCSIGTDVTGLIRLNRSRGVEGWGP